MSARIIHPTVQKKSMPIPTMVRYFPPQISRMKANTISKQPDFKNHSTVRVRAD